MNKVKFCLKRAYYAKATIGEDDDISYSTPQRIPGAVSIALSPEGDLTSLRADGTDYYIGASNNGYTGDLEMAIIPDSFRKDCLGEKEHSTDKTIYEVKSAQPMPFALLFEFEGDSKAIKHVMYLCYAQRASIEGENPDKNEPKTEKLSLKCVPREVDGLVKCKTSEETTSSVSSGWYQSVYVPEISEE